MSSQRLRLGVNSPVYEANANNIDGDAVDCGIKMIPCCGSPRCQKLGTTTTFLIVLVLVAIIQGASEKLVSISIQQAALEHDYNRTVIEWLLVTNGIAQGLFAILIAYWGNRIHKTNWLCGLLVFQAVTSVIVIIPTISHSDDSIDTLSTHVVDYLCTNRTFEMFVTELPHSTTNLIFLFLLQIGIGCGFVAFYTLGLTYLDDNALQHNSAALIGGALAGRFIGFQVGYILLIFLIDTSFGWWLGWAILSPLLFILAVIVGLFPMKLIASIVREAADEIVETATNNSHMSLSRAKLLSDISFMCSIKRILTNKVLILNVLATVFIQTALINYASQEQNYLQSRFLFPADDSGLLHNDWTSRIVTKFLFPLLVALAVLVGGLIIAKAKPSSRKVVVWNCATALIVCLLFVSFIFLHCTHRPLAGAYGGKLSQPFCSRSCICDSDIQFTPVCPTDGIQTFYSPCHAGCSSEQVINGQRVFGNCSCGIDAEIPIDGSGFYATEGACEFDECQKFWIIFQILITFGAVLIGSRLVGKILIAIRSVLPQDKALALASEITIVYIIAHIPGKIGYEAIDDWLCKYKSHDRTKCYIHDPYHFGNTINIVSAILCLIASILEVAVFWFVRDLDLYKSHKDETDGVRRYRTEQVHNFQRYPQSQEEESREESQPEQPLLTDLVTSPGLHTIQESQAEYPHQSLVNNESTQGGTSPNANGSPSNNSPLRISPSGTTRTVKLVLLKSAVPGTHIEELSVRLQQIKQQGDINPSVGDISDKESDLNIRQLEESVSSLSGIESSQFNSPEANRAPKGTINYKSIETDF